MNRREKSFPALSFPSLACHCLSGDTFCGACAAADFGEFIHSKALTCYDVRCVGVAQSRRRELDQVVL